MAEKEEVKGTQDKMSLALLTLEVHRTHEGKYIIFADKPNPGWTKAVTTKNELLVEAISVLIMGAEDLKW